VAISGNQWQSVAIKPFRLRSDAAAAFRLRGRKGGECLMREAIMGHR
jgi:hypothetical protein